MWGARLKALSVLLLCIVALGFDSGSSPLSAGTVQYEYDALGRLTRVTNADGSRTTYEFDAAGNRTVVTTTSTSPAGTFAATPTTLAQGASTTLIWTSVSSTSASIDHGVGNVSPASGGSISVSPTTSTIYNLTLTGAGSTTVIPASVTVIPPASGTLTANASTITAGSSSTLSWTSSGATSASISNGVGAVTAVAAGSVSVSPSTTTTYSLTLTNSLNVQTTRQATVTVVGAPSGTLTATPATIQSGGSSSLGWTGSNAVTASISPTVGSVTPVSGGSVNVTPSSTTTYTLTLTNAAGSSTTRTATVTVGGVNHPPVAPNYTVTSNDTTSTCVTPVILVYPLSNASDPDGDPLTLVSATNGTRGTTSISGSTITYTSSNCIRVNRTDSFTYTISDGHGGTATGTVTVDMNVTISG